MMRWLLQQWHRFTLGRTARFAGMLRSITYSGSPSTSSLTTYGLEFVSERVVLIEPDAFVATRKASDLARGVTRIVIESGE